MIHVRLTAVFLLTWVVAATSVMAADSPARLSVLFLGDQGHHRPAERAAWIKDPLASRGIAITYTEKLDDLNPTNLAKFDALLVYANIGEVSIEQEKAILDYVAGGKGFVPVHCASACFGKNPELVKLMGGRFKSHGTAVFRALIANREHATMQGFGGFDTWDETYVHDQHNMQDRTVLMERVDGGSREPWTWTRTHGQGRVFYTASGHDERTWMMPGFHDLLARGIAWAAGAKGEPVLNELLGPFAKAGRVALQYEERPTVQNYEKRTPAPQYQLPLSAKDSQDYIRTEQGFELKLFAAEPDVVKPIAFAWDHRGRLWVVESVDYPSKYSELWQGNDRIKICEDTDGDGKADKFTIFADKLNIPTGIVFVNGGVLVAQAPQFIFLKDTDGDDKADVKEVVMEGWGKGDTHAGPSNLHYGLDNRIYGALGYSGFNGEVGGVKLRFGQGLYRFDRTWKNLEYLSQYSNNTWGLGLSESGELFGSTANNTHHCYTPITIPQIEATRGLTATDELKRAQKIDAHYGADVLTEKIRQVDVFGGFTAAAGHNLYTARNFPQQYWNRTALVCEPTMHLLHQGFLKREGSGWTEDGDGGNLLAGEDQWVAPVQAEVGPDGAVWVADWYNFIIQHNPTPRKEHGGFDTQTGKGGAHVNPLRDESHGRIYRVVWKGAKPGRKSLDPAKPAELVQALTDDNQFWRIAAQRLLVERGNKDVVPALIALAKDQAVDAIGLNGGVVHALWTLHGLGALAGSDPAAFAVAVAALRHPSAGVRRNAVQVLPATAVSSSAVAESGILADQDLNVRLAAFLAVASLPASDAIGAALFVQSSQAAVKGDRNLPNALQIAVAQQGLGYLASAIKAGVKLPLAGEAGVALGNTNLAPNPGFEQMSGDQPVGWRPSTYTGKAVFKVVDGGRTGRCVEISATDDGGDVGWMATIQVKPKTRYRVSGWIKTKDLKGATGALFNLNGHPAKSAALNGTKDWKNVIMDFDSEDRTSVELNCLYGGWGKSTGTAWWDDVSVIELGPGGGAAVSPGQIERLIGHNLAHRSAAEAQIELVRRLADGDAGLAAAVLSGLVEGWNERDVPKEIGEAQRSALTALMGRFAPASQASLGAIIARWSGAALIAAKPTGPNLPPEELKRFESGKNRYSTLCIACHQPNGQGLPILAPSLVKSEWALGPATRPIRIILNGLQGPITANGVKFDSPAIMPPQKDVLDDVAIAEILTYVRNEWGNGAPPVQAAEVKGVREAEAKRTAPWTSAELQKIP